VQRDFEVEDVVLDGCFHGGRVWLVDGWGETGRCRVSSEQ
jgi:hypothetical protein